MNYRFKIHDLLLVVLALALALGWYVDRRQLIERLDTAEQQLLIHDAAH
jgi:hypothetical protein